MTILDIIKFPNKALTEKAKNIKNITNGTITCIKNMITTMYFFKGIGLASTQVNIKKKNNNSKYNRKRKTYYFNKS